MSPTERNLPQKWSAYSGTNSCWNHFTCAVSVVSPELSSVEKLFLSDREHFFFYSALSNTLTHHFPSQNPQNHPLTVHTMFWAAQLRGPGAVPPPNLSFLKKAPKIGSYSADLPTVLQKWELLNQMGIIRCVVHHSLHSLKYIPSRLFWAFSSRWNEK